MVNEIGYESLTDSSSVFRNANGILRAPTDSGNAFHTGFSTVPKLLRRESLSI